jgi:hypothetical protein
MLERLTSSASTEALKSALSSPTDIGGVASLLSDLAPHGVDLSAADPNGLAHSRNTKTILTVFSIEPVTTTPLSASLCTTVLKMLLPRWKAIA